MIPRCFKVGKVPHHMVPNTSFYMCKIRVPVKSLVCPGGIHVVSRYHCKGAPIDAAVARKRGENLVENVDDSWVTSMKAKLASVYCKSSSPFTICRVPTNIRKDDHAAYSPKIVSIGPYHRGTPDLEGMEQHKWRYLHKVLTHSKREKDLEKYLKEMKAIEPLARSCYAGNINMGMKKFVEMMVLDGCFVIHLLQQKDDDRNYKIFEKQRL